MSNKILTITATIELPSEVISQAKVTTAAAPLIGIMTDWLKDAGIKGTVTHDFVTKRTPKVTPEPDVKQAAE